MATNSQTGCGCKRCDAGLPHHPVDEDMILRALRNDPPIYGPVKRRLAFYDAKRISKPGFGGMTRQPWQPVRKQLAA